MVQNHAKAAWSANGDDGQYLYIGDRFGGSQAATSVYILLPAIWAWVFEQYSSMQSLWNY